MKHFARLNKHPITFEQFSKTVATYADADLLELWANRDKHLSCASTRVHLALLTHKSKNQLLVDFLAGTNFGSLVERGPTNSEPAADSAHGALRFRRSHVH
jgi:hypothetical protein